MTFPHADGTSSTGRLLVIGDIHGGYRAFDLLLTTLQPDQDDLIIILGDYIDRGHQSKEVVSRVIRLQKESNVISLRGNHEEMIMEWKKKNHAMIGIWLANGGMTTIQSYYEDKGLDAKMLRGEHYVFSRAIKDPESLIQIIPQEHWLFFERCRDWLETDDYIFVHGGVDPNLDMHLQTPHMLHWVRFNENQKAHKSGKKVICGHSPRLNGIPEDIGHTICIDTYLYGGLWLTGLDLTNGEYYQANNQGEVRVIPLSSKD
jgi:serine/threonine protein phosphatase 1